MLNAANQEMRAANEAFMQARKHMFSGNEGKKDDADDVAAGAYRAWSATNLFVYCSAESPAPVGFNPNSVITHHGEAHGEKRVQPAELRYRCSPAFGGCGGDFIEIKDGRTLEEIIRTRGDVEAALDSRYGDIGITCFNEACMAGANARAAVYLRCNGTRDVDGKTCRARSCDCDCVWLPQLLRATEEVRA